MNLPGMNLVSQATMGPTRLGNHESAYYLLSVVRVCRTNLNLVS